MTVKHLEYIKLRIEANIKSSGDNPINSWEGY